MIMNPHEAREAELELLRSMYTVGKELIFHNEPCVDVTDLKSLDQEYIFVNRSVYFTLKADGIWRRLRVYNEAYTNSDREVYGTSSYKELARLPMVFRSFLSHQSRFAWLHNGGSLQINSVWCLVFQDDCRKVFLLIRPRPRQSFL
ncbi:hypothetical protein FGIG_02864 [Fasciola gigantica]|uniref:Uncharacterized protein n=1 Tax=Fasciola gigantica TaxID=46835 RepID=A0A504YJN7_FASGI|nr:hypothetical protein FGIG_02864 [Fasciola gigantica]